MSDNEKRDWLVWERRSECWWGPNRGGYFKSILDAGLYTEEEAKAIEAFSNRYDRRDVAVPLTDHAQALGRLFRALYGETVDEIQANVDKTTTGLARIEQTLKDTQVAAIAARAEAERTINGMRAEIEELRRRLAQRAEMVDDY